MKPDTDLTADPGAAISIYAAARYMNIHYAVFRKLCSSGKIKTEVKFPGSKRLITTRAWCDEARKRWQKAGPPATVVSPPTAAKRYEGLIGRDLHNAIDRAVANGRSR